MTSMSKAGLIEAIAGRVGAVPPRMSTGSTGTKEIFLIVNESLGLGLDRDLTKPELAAAIVRAAGGAWLPDHESRGGTVTSEGLAAVLDAVTLLSAP